MTPQPELEPCPFTPSELELKWNSVKWRSGLPLPPVGTTCEVSGANADRSCDQDRQFTLAIVIGYTPCGQFACFQKAGCWPFDERLTNCWFRPEDILRWSSQPAGASETLTKGGEEPCAETIKSRPCNAAPTSDPLDAAAVFRGWLASAECPSGDGCASIPIPEQFSSLSFWHMSKLADYFAHPAPSPVPAERYFPAQPEPASETPGIVALLRPDSDTDEVFALMDAMFHEPAHLVLAKLQPLATRLQRELSNQREATKRADDARDEMWTRMQAAYSKVDSLQDKLTEAEESAKRSIGALTTEFERQMLAIVAERDAISTTVAELREDKLDLDWLETQDKKTNLGILYAGARPPIKGGGLQGSTLRAAIRAARATQQSKIDAMDRKDPIPTDDQSVCRVCGGAMKLSHAIPEAMTAHGQGEWRGCAPLVSVLKCEKCGHSHRPALP